MEDIASVLGRLNVPHRTTGEHSSNGWIQIDCPYCGPNTNSFHLGINLAFPRANCWKCGKKPLTKTLQLATSLSYDQCRKIVDTLPRADFLDKFVTPQKVILPRHIKDLQPAHEKYLRKRGFDPDEIIKLWGIRGFGFDHPDYKWRLFIPIDTRGHTVSYTTRSIAEGKTKRYIACQRTNEAIRHKSLLYGGDYVRYRAIVVEGPTDVWKVGPGAVGTFGIDYTQEQVKAIAQIPVRYICFDPEAEAKAEQLAEELSYFDGETHIIWLDAEDPGSASRKEILSLRKLLQ